MNLGRHDGYIILYRNKKLIFIYDLNKDIETDTVTTVISYPYMYESAMYFALVKLNRLEKLTKGQRHKFLRRRFLES